MILTFDDSVPNEAREHLSLMIPRCFNAGFPVCSLITCRPGFILDHRKLQPGWRIVYIFNMNEDGNLHVTVEE